MALCNAGITGKQSHGESVSARLPDFLVINCRKIAKGINLVMLAAGGGVGGYSVVCQLQCLSLLISPQPVCNKPLCCLNCKLPHELQAQNSLNSLCPGTPKSLQQVSKNSQRVSKETFSRRFLPGCPECTKIARFSAALLLQNGLNKIRRLQPPYLRRLKVRFSGSFALENKGFREV